MSRFKYILMAGFLTLTIAGTVSAQNMTTPNSGLGIGAHYSWVRNQETEKSSDMLGANVRLRGEVIGVEGSVDYRNEELGGNIELKSWPVYASLMVYPIPFAYGLAGLGWYNTTLDFPNGSLFDDETDTQLGYHLGAGVEVPVATSVGLTGDFRYEFVDYEFDEIPDSFGNKADALSLRGGIIFYLR